MYYGARGIVGLVKPTYRPGSMESFIKLMPEGVGFIPAHAGVRAGNEKELQEALTVAEKKVARLAELGADVVMIMGAPPTMVRGHGADREIADSLTRKYKIPVTVATIAQVDAFRALGMNAQFRRSSSASTGDTRRTNSARSSTHATSTSSK